MASLDNTVGRIEVGAWFAVTFYGFTVLQTHLYSQTQWNDPLRTRAFVFGIWLLETAHTALAIGTVYRLVVTKFGAPFASLDAVEWNEMLLPMIGILSALTSHCFFSKRAWLATHRSVCLAALSAVFSVLQVVFAVLATFPVFYSAASGPRWSILARQKTIQAVVILTLVCGLLEDLLLFTVLGRHVWRTRPGSLALSFPGQPQQQQLQTRGPSVRTARFSQQPPASTVQPIDHAFNTTTHYTLGALAFSVFLSFLALITYVLQPRDALFLGIFVVQSKVHANAILAYLNTRVHAPGPVRAQVQGSAVSRSIHFSPVEGPGPDSAKTHQFQLSSRADSRHSGLHVVVSSSTVRAGTGDSKRLSRLPDGSDEIIEMQAIPSGKDLDGSV